eukprot:scaffold259642_cov33-Tisochrysis_lutea.AAC.2
MHPLLRIPHGRPGCTSTESLRKALPRPCPPSEHLHLASTLACRWNARRHAPATLGLQHD